LTEAHAGVALPARIVRVQPTADGIELYFPPFRLPQVALALAAFGAIACALALVGAAVMLESAMVSTAGVLGAVMMVGFVAPLGVFGLIFLGLAVYMLANALWVRVETGGIVTRRTLFGLVVSQGRLPREALAKIEPEIASRHQSLFSSQPVYQLVAWDARHRTRLVVGESLHGATLMERVKALIESAATLRDAR
jgi:hypothetical protein